MILFPDLPDVIIEHVEVADEITLTLRTTSLTASCPNCGTSSTRVQSRYSRRLHDLPSVGRPVHLIVHLRRFFCKKSTCAQKIFTERLPELCRPQARAYHPVARGALSAWTKTWRSGGSRCGKRAGHQWKSRYHLAFGSPLSRASDIGTANHWIG
jgi:transposase